MSLYLQVTVQTGDLASYIPLKQMVRRCVEQNIGRHEPQRPQINANPPHILDLVLKKVLERSMFASRFAQSQARF